MGEINISLDGEQRIYEGEDVMTKKKNDYSGRDLGRYMPSLPARGVDDIEPPKPSGWKVKPKALKLYNDIVAELREISLNLRESYYSKEKRDAMIERQALLNKSVDELEPYIVGAEVENLIDATDWIYDEETDSIIQGFDPADAEPAIEESSDDE